jgi:hypothetical protein
LPMLCLWGLRYFRHWALGLGTYRNFQNDFVKSPK